MSFGSFFGNLAAFIENNPAKPEIEKFVDETGDESVRADFYDFFSLLVFCFCIASSAAPQGKKILTIIHTSPVSLCFET